ncbi:MAG: SDR family NAD(P)-dependent oxidoreductase [Myxococcaceae bacterium]
MQKLEGKVAIVAGGAGGVGEGIVRAFLGHGARVAVPSRDSAKLEALRQHVGADLAQRLFTLQGDLTAPGGVDKIRDDVVEALGPIDAVVASVGGWWQGAPLTDVPLDTWNTVLHNNLTSHFLLSKAFLPALAHRRGSTYTLINGSAAEAPVAQAGPACIAAAANAMLSRVLVEEHRGAPVRINTLVMGSIHTRASAARSEPTWLTADEIGEFCAHLASEEGHMIHGGLHHLLEHPA